MKVRTIKQNVLQPKILNQTVNIPNIGDNSTSGNLVSSVLFKRYRVTNSSLVWTITHNQNTDAFQAVLKDQNGNPFYAAVKTLNKSTFEVHLTDAMIGFVDVIFDKSGIT